MVAVKVIALSLLVLAGSSPAAMSAPLFGRGIVGLPILSFTFENLPEGAFIDNKIISGPFVIESSTGGGIADGELLIPESGSILAGLLGSAGLYDTWAGVVLAHTILAIPYVIIAVTTSLSLLDARLEQAARSLGATPLRTMVDVILPNIRTGVATAAVFAFVVSWDEIVVTLFVSSRAVYTLPRRMWDGIRESVDPTVAAVAVVLMALTALGVLAAIVVTLRRPARTT